MGIEPKDIERRGESFKSLFRELFDRYDEAVREGNNERAARHRAVLVKTAENAIDDGTNLMVTSLKDRL